MELEEKLRIQEKLLGELWEAAKEELMAQKKSSPLRSLLGETAEGYLEKTALGKLEHLEHQYRKSIESLRFHTVEARKRGWDK